MIVLFLLDTSASMNQRVANGMTLLDVGKMAIDHFIKSRAARLDTIRGFEKYMLVTYSEGPSAVKIGWKEPFNQFAEELKAVEAFDHANLESALKLSLDLLNVNRIAGAKSIPTNAPGGVGGGGPGSITAGMGSSAGGGSGGSGGSSGGSSGGGGPGGPGGIAGVGSGISGASSVGSAATGAGSTGGCIESIGEGRRPWFIEPGIIIVITDGEKPVQAPSLSGPPPSQTLASNATDPTGAFISTSSTNAFEPDTAPMSVDASSTSTSSASAPALSAPAPPATSSSSSSTSASSATANSDTTPGVSALQLPSSLQHWTNLVTAHDLILDPYRWDQRVFSIHLRFPRAPAWNPVHEPSTFFPSQALPNPYTVFRSTFAFPSPSSAQQSQLDAASLSLYDVSTHLTSAVAPPPAASGAASTAEPGGHLLPQGSVASSLSYITESPLALFCEETGGRSFVATSIKATQQSMELIMGRMTYGVVVSFEPADANAQIPAIPSKDPRQNPGANVSLTSYGVNPTPIPAIFNSAASSAPATSTSQGASQSAASLASPHRLLLIRSIARPAAPVAEGSLAYVLSLTANTSFYWPLPESYWIDSGGNSRVQPRKSHPIIRFSTIDTEPMIPPDFPFDKYELEPCPLTHYILSRRKQNACWQVFIAGSGPNDGLGHPFGFLKASSNNMCVHLCVLPYNYPRLFDLIHEFVYIHKSRPSVQWKSDFDAYLETVPGYYYWPLTQVFRRMQFSFEIPRLDAQSGIRRGLTRFVTRLSQLARSEVDRFLAVISVYKAQQRVQEQKDKQQELQVSLSRPLNPVHQKLQRLQESVVPDCLMDIAAAAAELRAKSHAQAKSLTLSVPQTLFGLDGLGGLDFSSSADGAGEAATVQEPADSAGKGSGGGGNQPPWMHPWVKDAPPLDYSHQQSLSQHWTSPFNPYLIQPTMLKTRLTAMRAILYGNSKQISGFVVDDLDAKHTVPVKEMGDFGRVQSNKYTVTELRSIDDEEKHVGTPFGNPWKTEKRVMIDEADEFASSESAVANRGAVTPKKKRQRRLSRSPSPSPGRDGSVSPSPPLSPALSPGSPSPAPSPSPGAPAIISAHTLFNSLVHSGPTPMDVSPDTSGAMEPLSSPANATRPATLPAASPAARPAVTARRPSSEVKATPTAPSLSSVPATTTQSNTSSSNNPILQPKPVKAAASGLPSLSPAPSSSLPMASAQSSASLGGGALVSRYNNSSKLKAPPSGAAAASTSSGEVGSDEDSARFQWTFDLESADSNTPPPAGAPAPTPTPNSPLPNPAGTATATAAAVSPAASRRPLLFTSSGGQNAPHAGTSSAPTAAASASKPAPSSVPTGTKPATAATAATGAAGSTTQSAPSAAPASAGSAGGIASVNAEIKKQAMKELRKPGKNYDPLCQQLDKLQGDAETKKAFINEIIEEANRLKRQHLVAHLKEYLTRSI